MKVIRGGSGLGDSLYVRGVVERLSDLEVRTDYPELFKDLDVVCTPFSRHNVDILAHYSKRKEFQTNQWEDVCIEAGIEPEPLRFTWNGKVNLGKPYVLIASPRTPMGRKDGFGAELLPDEAVFRETLEGIDCLRVLVGEKPIYPIPYDVDLTGKTSLSELMSLAKGAIGLIGQCSYIIPLAEGFDKPLLVLWSHKVFTSEHYYVRRINPRKILSGERSYHLYDDWDEGKRHEAIQTFKQESGQEAI